MKFSKTEKKILDHVSTRYYKRYFPVGKRESNAIQALRIKGIATHQSDGVWVINVEVINNGN